MWRLLRCKHCWNLFWRTLNILKDIQKQIQNQQWDAAGAIWNQSIIETSRGLDAPFHGTKTSQIWIWLVVEPTHLKNMCKSNGNLFPKDRGENSKNIQTTTWWNHSGWYLPYDPALGFAGCQPAERLPGCCCCCCWSLFKGPSPSRPVSWSLSIAPRSIPMHLHGNSVSVFRKKNFYPSTN